VMLTPAPREGSSIDFNRHIEKELKK